MSTPLLNTQQYDEQSGVTATYANQSATTASYTEQITSTSTYESLVRIDGTEYGEYSYGDDFYAGQPFLMGRR